MEYLKGIPDPIIPFLLQKELIFIIENNFINQIEKFSSLFQFINFKLPFVNSSFLKSILSFLHFVFIFFFLFLILIIYFIFI